MTRRIKKKSHEKLDDSTVSRVISLLEADNPITKKAACGILNISYNTKRLQAIIDEYQIREEYTKKRKALNKNKPFSEFEIKECILEYLKGESIVGISKLLYRNPVSVKKCLEKHNIPVRKQTKHSYFKPELIPDECVSENFEKDELVWAARYNCVAQIFGKFRDCYSIWVFGKYNEFAYQPWYELGRLNILKELGITEKDIKLTDNLNLEYTL